jgi:hypothetical protein
MNGGKGRKMRGNKQKLGKCFEKGELEKGKMMNMELID